jgi:hypothetical protein
MLSRLLPKRVDNTYGGYRVALWLLAVVLVMKAGIGLGSIFNGREAAGSADGIPLDTFAPAGAQAVVTLFALLGISNLMLCLMGTLVLVRYRALVPLMFGLFLLEHVSRKLALVILPIERTGAAPGFYVNLVILGVLILGLGLSLWRRRDSRGEE